MTQPEPQLATTVLHSALEFLLAGVNVVPVRHDGTKAPAGQWKQAQDTMTTADELVTWASNAQGFGIITGKVSGNLEMLELEGRAVAAGILEEARQLAHDADIGDIWDKLQCTYIEMTPSGGIHWLYRVETDVPSNTKIAQRPGVDDRPECWIETRGEGGFVIVAPSGGTVHPTGKPWVRLQGKTPADIVTLTERERQELHDLFRLFDRMPIQEEITRTVSTRIDDGNLSPGDDYNLKTTWDELLIPQGWRKIRQMSTGETHWCRPGKDVGISASTGRNSADNLFVWSTSTEFEQEKPYSKWAVYTLWNFGSVSEEAFRASTKALRGQGYGSISVVPDYALKPFQAPTAVNPETGEILEEGEGEQYLQSRGEELLLAAEIQQQRIRKLAREHLNNLEALKLYEPPTYIDNLTAELQLPDEDPTWTIDGLWPTGGNVLLTAAYKSGKTTLVNNVIKALCDNQYLFSNYEALSHEGRITFFNYEVDERTMRRWIADAGITNTNKVTMVHLRGKRLPLTIPTVEDYIVDLLKANNTQTWIVDPFARAFSGCGDENSNSDVGVFLETLDVIKERAGIENLILVAHTGRNAEEGNQRARGATRLDDWADVRWMLNKNDHGDRFFSASGRDVEEPEFMLLWDENTRRMAKDTNEKRVNKSQRTKELKEKEVLEYIRENPKCLSSDIQTHVKGEPADIRAAIKELKTHGLIIVEEIGRVKMHYTLDSMRKALEEQVKIGGLQ